MSQYNGIGKNLPEIISCSHFVNIYEDWVSQCYTFGITINCVVESVILPYKGLYFEREFFSFQNKK
ncbi:MAG: hypothetical protein B6241_05825 [Spirochaetaceae bacterium 4572_59]|nr:MAG: hypothetical protein B6241_05825 [Spirochaetaceae bacterium 4572_59]